MSGIRASLLTLLRERGIRLTRRRGQNFLVDPNFLEAMARDVGAGTGDGVIEIGSGPGNLTERLAARAGRVWAFEIDPGLHALSGELLKGLPNVELVCGDGAEFDRHPGIGGRRLHLVSNLPYSDWQRLALRALSTALPVESFTFMVQEDVWRRLGAAPRTKGYGPLPVLFQAACRTERLRKAGPALFLPRPQVASVVFRATRLRPPGFDFAAAEAVLRALFAQRRKKSLDGRRVEEFPPAELLQRAADPPSP